MLRQTVTIEFQKHPKVSVIMLKDPAPRSKDCGIVTTPWTRLLISALDHKQLFMEEQSHKPVTGDTPSLLHNRSHTRLQAQNLLNIES